jgi:hypothetical protein
MHLLPTPATINPGQIATPPAHQKQPSQLPHYPGTTPRLPGFPANPFPCIYTAAGSAKEHLSIYEAVHEHILVSNIMGHLEKGNILTDGQHGFRRGRSTETQLILTSHDYLE